MPLQIREQRNLFVKIAVGGGILAFLLSLLAAGLIDSDKLASALKYVSVSTVIGSGLSVVIYALALRIRWVRSLLGILDFSGRWEGWSRSAERNGHDVLAVEIAQSGLVLSIACFSELASAESKAAAIIADESETRYSLLFTCDVKSNRPDEKWLDNHFVTFMLRLQTGSKEANLRGEYFSDRKRADGERGTQGSVLLAKSPKKPLGGAYYQPEDWALKLPGSWVGEPKVGFDSGNAPALRRGSLRTVSV